MIVVKLNNGRCLGRLFCPHSHDTNTAKSISKNQVIASALINAVLNGLIAFFSYRTRGDIPYGEAAIDILITVAIIGFLSAGLWLVLPAGRLQGKSCQINSALPENSKGGSLRALIIMLFCVVVFGACPGWSIYLISPDGFSNWAYIVTKTLYTGRAVPCSLLACWSVLVREQEINMERYGSVIKLKPEKVAEYKDLHANVWPECWR